MGQTVSCFNRIVDGATTVVFHGGDVRAAFHRWLRFAYICVQSHLNRERVKVEGMSLRMAQQLQQIADHENTIARALQQLHRRNVARVDAEDARDNVTCVVCAHVVKDCVRCDIAEHATCLACVERYAETLYASTCDEFPQRVACQAVGGCTGCLPLARVMQTRQGGQLVREMHHRTAMHHVIDAIGRDGLDGPTALMRLRYVRHDGTYNAHACPKCGHGPMEHFRCSDLAEFHETRGYRNACPRCGLLTQDVAHLSEWSGSFGIKS